MKKTFFILSLIASVVALVSFIRVEAPHYENLKVLPKDINKHEMDSVMRHFSFSLSVRCTFCHVREESGMKDFDFASDKNEHKLVARDMFKMMKKINEKYFEHGDKENMNRIPDVSCYTCHNGKEIPENIPPPPPPQN